MLSLILYLAALVVPVQPAPSCEAFDRIDGTSVMVCDGSVVSAWETVR